MTSETAAHPLTGLSRRHRLRLAVERDGLAGQLRRLGA
jgi:hypothetical protein